MSKTSEAPSTASGEAVTCVIHTINRPAGTKAATLDKRGLNIFAGDAFDFLITIVLYVPYKHIPEIANRSTASLALPKRPPTKIEPPRMKTLAIWKRSSNACSSRTIKTVLSGEATNQAKSHTLKICVKRPASAHF